MKLLDCTLRDGGYYNNWDFPPELVQDYINALSGAGVKIIELGFRQLPQDKFLGACAYTTDRFISSLDIPDRVSLAVMIDAKEVLSSGEPVDATLNRLFREKAGSKVEYVRVAVNVKKARETEPIIEHLSGLGYRVCLNLMQINTVTLEELAEITAKLRGFSGLEILYFADTLGNLLGEDIAGIVATMRANCDFEVGFHSHNNCNLALSNAICALNLGCWVDGTITGMGRGAGNAQTEYLLIEMQRRNLVDRVPMTTIQSLISKYFEPLREHYGWGANIYYYLGAVNNLHPSYIQQMISTERYTSDDILNIISLLSKDTLKNNYDPRSLMQVASGGYTSEKGDPGIKNMLAGREILLLAAGPEGLRHKNELINYIKNHKPVVIMLNYPPYISEEYIDYYIASYPTRLDAMALKSDRISKPIIAPKAVINENLFGNAEIIDYGLKVNEKKMAAHDSGCILPAPLAAPYSLCFAISAGAKRVLLAGFDGYLPNDDRYYEMKNILSKLSKISDIELVAVTPTHYPIAQKSIYMEEI